MVEVIKELTPQVINRKCAKHIYDNFKLKWRSADLRKYFWWAVTSYTSYGFNKAMAKMKEGIMAKLVPIFYYVLCDLVRCVYCYVID